jgi:hypothetical protein
MFQGGFQEERSHTTNLPDFEPEYFALVLQWFYTGLVVFSDGTAYIGKNDPKTMNEAVKMFLFADRYDTRSLRLQMFDILATWVFGCSTEGIPLDAVAVAKALAQFPETSGLYKLFSDLIIYSWTPASREQSIEVARYLPAAVIGRMFIEGLEDSKWRVKKAPYGKDMCQYHEHLNDLERDNCAKEMKERTSSLNIDVFMHARLSKRKEV